MKFYLVGGKVRDDLLSIPSKDIDFSCVMEQNEISFSFENNLTPFEYMVEYLKEKGFKIFLETPEYLTVRAQFPKNNVFDFLEINKSLTADFVLARKESGYADGRRPDKVEPGTLEDDLGRRDFTINAIAQDEKGNYIDPFGGMEDIKNEIICAVGNPFDRLSEDALRAVRAMRFSVTKRFTIEDTLSIAMQSEQVLDSIVNNISDERIQVELSKMFRYDTVSSIEILNLYPALTDAMFSGQVSLDATLKTKGRGK